MAGSTNSIVARNVLRGRLSEDNLMAGAVGTAYNPTYAIVTETGAQIVLYINSSNYQFYAELKDKYGNHISNSNIIDLPLESMVVDGSYDAETKEVVLILDNGNEVRFSVADLVEGLVSTEQLTTILGDYVKFTDYATTSTSGVIIAGYHQFNISEGRPYASNASYVDYQNMSANSFISKGTLENVITGKELTNKEYVDTADEVFKNDLFGDEIVSDNGENIILDNTTEAPLKIELKGNTYQYSTTGKNLWDENTQTFANQSLMSISKDNNNVWTFTSTGSGYAFAISKITLQAGTYTFSSNCTNGNTAVLKGSTSLQNTFTITEETEITYRVYKQNAVAGDVVKLSNVMIEKNNQETPYEPYTGGIASPNPDYPQDIQVVSGDNTIKVEGKNLLKIEDREGTSAGITYTIKDGIITFNGTATGSGALYIYIDKTFDRNETFSLVKEGTATGINNPMQWVRDGTTRYTYNSLFKSGDRLMQLYFTWVSGATANNYVVKPMLEVGSTATTYEPYVSQTYPISLGDIELCKIGTYQDKIYKDKDNGKWYLNKQIGKLVLDGSESGWIKSNLCFQLNDNNAEITTKLANASTGAYNTNYNFEYWASGITSNLSNYAFGWNSTKIFTIRDDRYSTASDYTTYLSTNNQTFYIPLLNPTTTPITDTTLLSQLEDLEKAKSYNEQTNLNQTNNDMPFEIAVTAFVDSTAGKLAATAAQINTLNEIDNDLSANKEDKSNKVATISASSTDTEYPTAKCIYDIIGDVESLLEALDIGSGV